MGSDPNNKGQQDNYRRTEDNWQKAMNDTVPKSESKGNGGGCFIATAAFGNYNAPEVVYLSNFRDDTLNRSLLGRFFIRAYYALSPRFAEIIAKSDFLKSAVRKMFLQPIIFLLKKLRK